MSMKTMYQLPEEVNDVTDACIDEFFSELQSTKENKPKASSSKKGPAKSNALLSDPNHDKFLGYLIAVFVNETIAQAIECCPGCKDWKNSPLLHTHHHSGLLEKLYMFTPSVKAMLISKLRMLVTDYISKFPDPEIYDEAGQKVLIKFGRDFIRQCTPTFVYYSRYLSPSLDQEIGTPPIIHTQPVSLKRISNILDNVAKQDQKRKKVD